MSLIDRCHLKVPLYGTRGIRGGLIDEGYRVNRKRVQRHLHTMGLEALYPGRNLSKANQAHKAYPYLLRNLFIDAPASFQHQALQTCAHIRADVIASALNRSNNSRAYCSAVLPISPRLASSKTGTPLLCAYCSKRAHGSRQ